jgi:hypothetical protein
MEISRVNATPPDRDPRGKTAKPPTPKKGDPAPSDETAPEEAREPTPPDRRIDVTV